MEGLPLLKENSIKIIDGYVSDFAQIRTHLELPSISVWNLQMALETKV